MKRNLLAMASACVLLAAAVFTGPAGVMADTTDKITSSEPDVNDVSTDDEIGSTSVDTTVKLANYQDDVVYSITITAGKMIFNYDYGAVWDPAKHTYTNKAGNPDGSWSTADLNGTNNKISITNDSNYPVTAELEYSHNAEFEGIADEVEGVFDSEKGCTNSDLTSSYSVDLNIDTSKLDAMSGTPNYTYWVLTNHESDSNKQDVFFKYQGTPNKITSDSKLEYASAGTITVTIRPADATEKKTQ